MEDYRLIPADDWPILAFFMGLQESLSFMLMFRYPERIEQAVVDVIGNIR
jgi:hypothetical protein